MRSNHGLQTHLYFEDTNSCGKHSIFLWYYPLLLSCEKKVLLFFLHVVLCVLVTWLVCELEQTTGGNQTQIFFFFRQLRESKKIKWVWKVFTKVIKNGCSNLISLITNPCDHITLYLSFDMLIRLLIHHHKLLVHVYHHLLLLI